MTLKLQLYTKPTKALGHPSPKSQPKTLKRDPNSEPSCAAEASKVRQGAGGALRVSRPTGGHGLKNYPFADILVSAETKLLRHGRTFFMRSATVTNLDH